MRKYVLLLVVVLVVPVLAEPPASQPATRADVAALQLQIDQLRQMILDLQRQLESGRTRQPTPVAREDMGFGIRRGMLLDQVRAIVKQEESSSSIDSSGNGAARWDRIDEETSITVYFRGGGATQVITEKHR